MSKSWKPMSKSWIRKASMPDPVLPFSPRAIAESEQEQADLSRAVLACLIGGQLLLDWLVRADQEDWAAFIRFFTVPMPGELPEEPTDLSAEFAVLWNRTCWFAQLDLFPEVTCEDTVATKTADSVTTLPTETRSGRGEPLFAGPSRLR